MDKDVCSWILEFILRQPQIDDETINTLLTVLPLPHNRFSLTKSLLLRRILSEPSASQNILDLLEITDELHRLASLPSPPSLPRAYLNVAVECTAGAEGPAEYFEAVRSVWRGRVGKMDKECGLVSEELVECMEEVEAGVWDEGARERVRGRWREGEAVRAVREYVAEAWEGLGPALLDEVAGLVEAGDEVAREVLGVGVREEGFGGVEDDGGVGGGYDETRKDDTTRDVLGVEDNRVPHHQPIVDSVNDVSQNGKRMPRRKHVAKKRYRGSVSGTSRGAKITDTEQVDNKELSNIYGCLPSPAIDKVQEALKNSSLELHAVVTDPLPEALKLAENAISTKNKDSRVPEYLANEADPKRTSTSVENNIPKPNLMTRNTSARTYEWDDSIDDSTEGDTGSSGSRIKLPSPKNRVVSPLPKPQIRNTTGRRKSKKWSMLEEETLRTGVEKYGQGCWKAILNSYRDIFEDRTDTDLKDKWRNMTRYPR